MLETIGEKRTFQEIIESVKIRFNAINEAHLPLPSVEMKPFSEAEKNSLREMKAQLQRIINTLEAKQSLSLLERTVLPQAKSFLDKVENTLAPLEGRIADAQMAAEKTIAAAAAAYFERRRQEKLAAAAAAMEQEARGSRTLTFITGDEDIVSLADEGVITQPTQIPLGEVSVGARTSTLTKNALNGLRAQKAPQIQRNNSDASVEINTRRLISELKKRSA